LPTAPAGRVDFAAADERRQDCANAARARVVYAATNTSLRVGQRKRLMQRGIIALRWRHPRMALQIFILACADRVIFNLNGQDAARIFELVSGNMSV
jgi:hypothetical protein